MGGIADRVAGAGLPARRRTLALAALAAAGGLGWAALGRAADRPPLPATLDLLERPAPATGHGQRKLLLDVTTGGPGLVAVGEFGLLLGSADQGRSWQQLPGPTSVMLTAVHFVDARHGWAVGHDGVVLATTDAGRSWARRFDGRQANAAVLVAARAQVAAAAAAAGASPAQSQARQDRAADALAAAEDAVKAGPSSPLLALRFVDRQRGWVAGAFGQLFATADGGARWTYLGDRLDNPDGLHLNGLTVTPQGELYIAAEMGRVFRSADGGQTWQRADTGYNGHLYGVLALPGGGATPATLLAYGFNGHLFRSRDRGASWSALPRPGVKTLVAGALHGDAALLLSEDGRLYLSRDGGEHFQPLGGPLGTRRLAGFALLGEHLVAVGSGGVSVHTLALDAAGAPR